MADWLGVESAVQSVAELGSLTALRKALLKGVKWVAKSVDETAAVLAA